MKTSKPRNKREGTEIKRAQTAFEKNTMARIAKKGGLAVVAEKMGVGVSTIHAKLHAGHSPSLRTVSRFATALGCHTIDLLK